MCDSADKVFRGTVVSAAPGTLRVGGLDLPTTTYRLRVDEAFKGEFPHARGGGRRVVVRMLSAPNPDERSREARGARFLADLPQLQVGESYLLLSTRPSSIGTSTTVGLGQGLFRIHGTAPRPTRSTGTHARTCGTPGSPNRTLTSRLAPRSVYGDHDRGRCRRVGTESRPIERPSARRSRCVRPTGALGGRITRPEALSDARPARLLEALTR